MPVSQRELRALQRDAGGFVQEIQPPAEDDNDDEETRLEPEDNDNDHDEDTDEDGDDDEDEEDENQPPAAQRQPHRGGNQGQPEVRIRVPRGKNNQQQGRNNHQQGRVNPVVARMQAQLAIVENRQARGNGQDEMELLIKECVKDELWSLAKIVSGPNQREALAEKCLELLDLEDFRGDTDIARENRRGWIKAYGPIIVKHLNAHRSYVQNQIKKACNSWQAEHGGLMPSHGDLLKCLKREINPNNTGEYALFKWYWDELLTKAAGNLANWHTDHRHYMCISTAAPPNNANAKYITPSTEAFAVACCESNRTKWEALWTLKVQYPNVKDFKINTKIRMQPNGKDPVDEVTVENAKTLRLNHTKYHGLFTNLVAGQAEFSAWTPQGRSKFYEYRRANKQARGLPNTKVVEEATLALIKQDYGLIAPSADEERRRKRRRTIDPAEVVAEEEDAFDF